nr:helicase [Tanacetum cinerariifolium]
QFTATKRKQVSLAIGRSSAENHSLTNILKHSVMIHSNTIIRRDGKVQSYCALQLKKIATSNPVPDQGRDTLHQQAIASTSNYPFFDAARRKQVRNRMGAFIDKDNDDGVDATTVQSLIQMQYNKPTVAEVVALITNDFGDRIPSRDVIVNKQDYGPKRISEFLAYMALQYPLLFPYGEDGFHEKIPYHSNICTWKTNHGFVTMKEYYSYIIQQINDQGATLTRGDRLFQQYLVGAYSVVEEQRLKWTRNSQDTLRTADQIDYIILVELPSPTDGLDGYKAVTDYMLHGPCDEDGYPIYRRRDNKASAKKGKFTFDNRHVVPRNCYLLLKYQAHINVEWCNKSKAIKYLFKYLNKGPDRATVVIHENVQKGDNVTPEKVVEVDEINNYLNCRYLAPCEAMWRLFSFDIHYSYPSVKKLNFHLLNQNPVTLRDSECLPALLEREACHSNYGKKPGNFYRRIFYTEKGNYLDFQDLPHLNPQLLTNIDNRHIREALDLHMNKSGRGKTFLYNTIIARLRTERKIVLAVASLGIAALLLPSGRTAHSRFIIPLELLEKSTCCIKQNTHLAELMKEVQLIIWDEAPMTQKYAFEALDKTLRDILGFQNPKKRANLWRHDNVVGWRL